MHGVSIKNNRHKTSDALKSDALKSDAKHCVSTKIKTTMIKTEFAFLGNSYSILILLQAQVLKTYWETSHSERKLVCDRYGRLFHYRLDEEMSFDDRPDREDYLWVLVTDEKDSDSLIKLSNLSLLRPPYIAADENGWVGVHETE